VGEVPSNVPIGPTALELAIAVRTSSMASHMADSRAGSTLTRMAGCSEPATVTSATPSTWLKTLRDDAVGAVVDRAGLQGLRR